MRFGLDEETHLDREMAFEECIVRADERGSTANPFLFEVQRYFSEPRWDDVVSERGCKIEWVSEMSGTISFVGDPMDGISVVKLSPT